MRKILERKNGEGYIDVVVTVMIVSFVLVFAVNMVSLVALNQNVKTVADQLTEYASVNGTTEIGSYAEDLRQKTGIDFTYSFAGSTTNRFLRQGAARRADCMYRDLPEFHDRVWLCHSSSGAPGIGKRAVAGLLEVRNAWNKSRRN